MINNRTRWFHSSRVILPFLSMSASWFLVSTHLIWSFGPRWFCQTTNRVRLWVRDTCLIIWASFFDDHLDHWPPLSSKCTAALAFVVTCSRFDNWSTFWLLFFFNSVFGMCKLFPVASLNPLLFPGASLVDDFLWFDECNTPYHHIPHIKIRNYRSFANQHTTKKKIPLLWNWETLRFLDACWMFWEECNTSVTTSHKSRAGIPQTSIKRNNFRFCETLKFVSYTSNLQEHMFDFQGYKKFHPRLISNLQDLPQSQSLENSPSLHCLAVLPTRQYCRWSFVWWMKVITRAEHSSQTLVHFVTARANLFADQRMSGPPVLAKYKHFKKIRENTLENSPTVSNSSFLKLWSRKHGVET